MSGAVIQPLLLTLGAWMVAKMTHRYFPALPPLLVAMLLVSLGLLATNTPYPGYYRLLEPLFSALIGLSLVALAIPLAAISGQHIQVLRQFWPLLMLGSIVGVALPVSLAFLLHMPAEYLPAYATRAVTTPFALAIGSLIHSPVYLSVTIVIFSGIMGALALPLLMRRNTPDALYGLVMGLTAHAVGTAASWRRSRQAGEYAALGTLINGLLTSLWLPPCWTYFFGSF